LTSQFRMIVFVGFACLFVPLVVLGLAYTNAEWNTVAQEIAYPILATFFVIVSFILLFVYLRR